MKDVMVWIPQTSIYSLLSLKQRDEMQNGYNPVNILLIVQEITQDVFGLSNFEHEAMMASVSCFNVEGNHQLQNMSVKPKLTYFNGRGRMESTRWLLAAAGVDFEEEFVETKEQYEKLCKDGALLFGQLPLVEMDGMKLVQTRAILNYIARKYNLYGKTLKDRAHIDMYVEGTMDLFQMLLMFPFTPPEQKEKQAATIFEKATTRYFPVYEKALKTHGQEFLVGNSLSYADVQLLEAILAIEEIKPDVLAQFPKLQAFKTRISNIPTIKKFLQPGSQKKPPVDATYVATVMKILAIE